MGETESVPYERSDEELQRRADESYDREERSLRIKGWTMLAGGIIAYSAGMYWLGKATQKFIKDAVKAGLDEKLLELAEQEKIYLKTSFFGR